MIVVKSLSDTHQISNIAIRELVRQRIDDLGGDAYDASELGYFLVVESGDTIEAINAQLGFDIMCNRMTGVRYGEPGFAPSFEFVEEFSLCYDLVFILGDDGFGVEVFAPKEEGIDPALLALLKSYTLNGTP